MSVLSLSPDLVSLWAPAYAPGPYGVAVTTWSLAYASVPARIVYRSGGESVQDGKEQVIPTHEIFLHRKYVMDESFRITDQDGHVYDIVSVNRLYAGTHMQVMAEMVSAVDPFPTAPWESSSSSSDSSDSSPSSQSNVP